MNIGHCKDCRWWDDVEAYDGGDKWDRSHQCNHPEPKMASTHCASANYYGNPVTLADFGCIQFESSRVSEK